MPLPLLLLILPLDPFDRAVADLSARPFRTRQQAERQLHRLGWPAVPRLRQAAAGAADPEARRRLVGLVERLQAERRQWAARTVRHRYGDMLPMIDATWLNTRTRGYDLDAPGRKLAYRWLRPYLDAARDTPDGRRWSIYRVAAEAWFTDLLEAGLPVWALDILYLETRRRDNLWIEKLGLPLDPWHWPGWTEPPPCPHEMPGAIW